MKKIILIFVIAFTANLFAQKFGHVNSGEIVQLMPEMNTVKVKMDSIQKKLGEDFQVETAEYEKLMKEYEKMVADGASENMLKLKQDEIITKQEFLQKYQATLEEEVYTQQDKLTKPLLEKLQTAIKEVSTEKGLTYVFDIASGALLYYNPADDINADVKKKLGIKVQ